MVSTSKTPAWQSKLVDEPRIGFVEEHGSRAKNLERATLSRRQQQPEPAAPTQPPKPDRFAKILNEKRIGFETLFKHTTQART
jgi:hypothetical protein